MQKFESIKNENRESLKKFIDKVHNFNDLLDKSKAKPETLVMYLLKMFVENNIEKRPNSGAILPTAYFDHYSPTYIGSNSRIESNPRFVFSYSASDEDKTLLPYYFEVYPKVVYSDHNNWTDTMFVFRYCSDKERFHYLIHRNESLKSSAELRNSGGWTEAMFAFRYCSDDDKRLYMRFRGETLKDTAKLRNADGETEATFVSRDCSEEVKRAYSNQCKEISRHQPSTFFSPKRNEDALESEVVDNLAPQMRVKLRVKQ